MKKPVIVLRFFNIFAVNLFKMEKAFIILAAVLSFSLTACSQGNNKKENKEMKTLVVYFSATGTTKAAAQRLAKEFNADLYEITPEVPYTAADLDWRDKQSRSTIEMQDKTSRPAIKGRCENIADYDTVWIGFPLQYSCLRNPMDRGPWRATVLRVAKSWT